jgi:hypothetical protein
VSADGLFIFVRLLLFQQPGNTHGIYRRVWPYRRVSA